MKGKNQMDTIKVLVADDHTGFRTTLTSYLRIQPGVEVVGEVTNGQEAVAQALALDPDIVLVDVRMPQTNGIDAAREIKVRRPDACVVVMSAGGHDIYRSMALQNNADAFLDKSSMKASLQTLLSTFQRPLQPMAA